MESLGVVAVLVILVLADCARADDDEDNFTRIVGGKFVDISQVPYQAQVLIDDRSQCGASIISPYWLISAAHCFAGSFEPTFAIITGSSLSSSGTQREIEHVFPHPEYNSLWHHDNDIALIKLKDPIRFNRRQRPIRLAIQSPKLGDVMTISGYGYEALRIENRWPDQPGRHLKAANVTVFDLTECSRRYAAIFTTVSAQSVCAGAGGTGSCTADSGGPAVIDGRLAGVVSGGYECNTRYYPGIYTRVDLYRGWVAKLTGLVV